VSATTQRQQHNRLRTHHLFKVCALQEQRAMSHGVTVSCSVLCNVTVSRCATGQTIKIQMAATMQSFVDGGRDLDAAIRAAIVAV